jgi:hypothetical protein
VRTLALPLIAALLVTAVLGVQVAAGGGDYVPRRPANPCAPRPVPPVPARLEPLAERIVLLGIDGAACRLGVSRERFVLDLANDRSPDRRTTAALHAGLRDAVDRLDREHRLPRVSQLLPKALAQSGLPGIVKTIIGLIPAGTVDRTLPAGPLLRRTVDRLDIGRLLRELDDPARLSAAVRAAILRSARDEILGRLHP